MLIENKWNIKYFCFYSKKNINNIKIDIYIPNNLFFIIIKKYFKLLIL